MTRRSKSSKDAGQKPGQLEWLWYGAFLLLVFLLGCTDVRNADIWWHLRTGELIWQRGHVPVTDWYTYTNPDVPWIDLHWGFQLGAAGIWSFCGTTGLVLVKSLIGTAVFAVCLTTGRKEWPAFQTVGIWLAPLLLFSMRYYVRPEILTLLFLATTLAILHHSSQRPRILWLLPLVQLFWVNTQGLFVLQFVVLGCYVFEALVDQIWKPKLNTKQAAKGVPLNHLLGSCAASAFATLLNPYGMKGALFPLTLMQRVSGEQRKFFHAFSEELKGMDVFLREHGLQSFFSDVTNFLFLFLLLCGVVSFAILFYFRQLRIYRILLFACFAYLAWQMRRNAIPFALVGGVVLRLNIGECLDLAKSREAKSKQDKESGQTSRERRPLIPILVGAVLGLLMVQSVTSILPPFRPGFGLGTPRPYKDPASEFLKQPGMPDEVYAYRLSQAAICIYHLSPEKRVFADARLETNTQKNLAQFRVIAHDLSHGNPRAEELLIGASRTDGQPYDKLPALVFENRSLVRGTYSKQNLLQGILSTGRWRCVFSSLDPDLSLYDEAMILSGTTIFLAEPRAEKLELPAKDISVLVELSNIHAAMNSSE